jgi:predicted nucleic acid-binding protein
MVVADTSPLIFLGKIRQLELLPLLFGGEILIPSLVEREVLARPISPAEELTLRAFLSEVKVLEIAPEKRFAAGLSLADTATLALAIRESADLLLADDRLLRRMAEVESVRPMGTLGVLLQAEARGCLTTAETRALLSDLVQEHQFRIGIEVFEAVLRKLDF